MTAAALPCYFLSRFTQAAMWKTCGYGVAEPGLLDRKALPFERCSGIPEMQSDFHSFGDTGTFFSLHATYFLDILNESPQAKVIGDGLVSGCKASFAKPGSI